MEEMFSQQQAAGTGRIYSERYANTQKEARHRTKNGAIGSKTKTITACILCLTFFLSLPVQKISAQTETVQEEQTQQKPTVTFSQLNDREVFLKQSQARVCTLTSCAMMIRRAAMLSGDTNWRQITEQSVRKTAWAKKPV